MNQQNPKNIQTKGKFSKKKEFMKFYKQNERSLSLYQSQLNDEDIKAIMEHGLCINILWLSINNLTQLGAQYLSKGKLQLMELYIGWNRLGPEGVKCLSRAHWPKLKKIWIVNNKIGANGAKYLAQADWKQLQELNVGHNQIEDRGCNYLMKANWKNLKKLWLAQNNIKESGLKVLVKADWKKLTHFSLWFNLISEQGCFSLQSVDWKNLISLNLLRNKIESSSIPTIKLIFAQKSQSELELDI